MFSCMTKSWTARSTLGSKSLFSPKASGHTSPKEKNFQILSKAPYILLANLKFEQVSVQLPVQLLGCMFNCSDVCSTAQMLLSIARLLVKLVERLLLMTGDKLNCSDKLKTLLLSEYKVLED